MDLALENGADGVVVAVLTEHGHVDTGRCQILLRQLAGREAVFSRAFDVTPDPFAALEQLIELGFKRVMTSGQEVTAYNGAGLIAELIRRAAGRIEVLPAGGINRFTVADVVARTGCNQVHASLRKRREDRSVSARPHIVFGTSNLLPENAYETTSVQAVTQVRECLHSIAS
jgi:copper homeostasis protein